jgi:hypothetical protein
MLTLRIMAISILTFSATTLSISVKNATFGITFFSVPFILSIFNAKCRN